MQNLHASSSSSSAGGAPWSLLASLAPGVLFGLGLLVLSNQRQLGWLNGDVPLPWELIAIGLCGAAATWAGVADWRYHRREGIRVGPNEHKYELLALAGGGLPLFVLMTAASLTTDRRWLLLPILVVALFTAVAISYDEFVFHRKRCGRYETLLHRVLVLGHTAAWLAWMHWCFVRNGLL